MDWQGGRRSNNVQDRRGMGVKATGSIGLGGIIIVLIGWALGISPSTMLGFVQGAEQFTSHHQTSSQTVPQNDEQGQFASVILASNEDFWNAELKQNGAPFSAAKMVLFSGQTQSACGIASSATGPFYCPADQKIYIDLGFINEMQKLGATNQRNVAGNFAMAYVIGHEYGHHISNLVGILPKAHQAMQQANSKAQANAISVRLELQADCFAGVWAANLGKYRINVTQRDLQEGLQAASAVGDDHITKTMTGRAINPENFTHGSSQQRMQWFSKGLQAGNMRACNTFAN